MCVFYVFNLNQKHSDGLKHNSTFYNLQNGLKQRFIFGIKEVDLTHKIKKKVNKHMKWELEFRVLLYSKSSWLDQTELMM